MGQLDHIPNHSKGLSFQSHRLYFTRLLIEQSSYIPFLVGFCLGRDRHPWHIAISQQTLLDRPVAAEQQLERSLCCKCKDAAACCKDRIDIERVAHDEGQLVRWRLQVGLALGCNHMLNPICMSYFAKSGIMSEHRQLQCHVRKPYTHVHGVKGTERLSRSVSQSLVKTPNSTSAHLRM